MTQGDVTGFKNDTDNMIHEKEKLINRTSLKLKTFAMPKTLPIERRD